MLQTHNFTPLIISTQEQRDANGGNIKIYTELSSYLNFAYIREIVSYTFRNDAKIMLKIKKLEALEVEENLDSKIDLEKFPWLE